MVVSFRLCVFAAAAFVATPALAQVSADTVTPYTPAFFADFQPNTALDMIRRMPGFVFDEGSSGRGFAGTAGNVLIDGERPASRGDSLGDILARIPASTVERIDLIRGGAPGIDMQGRSVIANIVLKRTVTTSKVVETNAYLYTDGYIGPLLSGQFSRREGDKQTEAAFSITTDRTNGTSQGDRTRWDSSGTPYQLADLDLGDRYREASLRGAVQLHVGGGKLRVNGLINYANFNTRQDIFILSGPGTSSHNEDVDHSWTGELGANWTRALGTRTELNIVALQRRKRERYDSSGFDTGGATFEFDTDADSSESIVRSVVKFRQSDRWAFEGGGEIAYNALDTSTRYIEDGLITPLPNAQVRVSELRGEGFGQTTFRPSSTVTLEAGMRVELSRISQTGDTDKARSFVYPKPRFQLTWRPAKNHQLRFRVQKTVGQLDFSDFTASTEVNLGTVVGGNAELVPQKSLIFEGVYEYRFWNRGSLELTASHAKLDDVIDVIPLVGGFEAVGNIGSGTTDLFQAKMTLPLDKLGVRNALLLLRTTFRKSSVIDPLTGDHRRLSGELPFGCSASFNHDIMGGRFSYGFDYRCDVDNHTYHRIREIRTTRNPRSLALFAQWKPNPKLTIRLDLGNVANYTVENRRAVYAGPRDTAPLSFNERRELRRGQNLYIQLRHTL